MVSQQNMDPYKDSSRPHNIAPMQNLVSTFNVALLLSLVLTAAHFERELRFLICGFPIPDPSTQSARMTHDSMV